jgi:two-component system OmpR family sensor kinase
MLSILDYIDEIILFLNDTTVVYSNKKAKEYFGDCEGHNIFELLIFEKGSLLVDAIHSQDAQESVEFEDRIFSNRRGGWIYFKLRYIKESSVLILKDITEERNLQEVKMNISSLIAHELKNPIGVLLSHISELIEDETDEENIVRFLKIEKQALRINRIVEQVEYITMAQLGLYTPKVASVNIKKLVESVIDDISELIEVRKAKIEKHLSVDKINGDEFIIRTILKNLLSNAVKYSFDNSKVIVKITDEFISVRDFGVGIPDEEIPKIFNRFYRTSTGVKMASGSGLGLAVVKHLANIANYRIEVKSQHMIGTEFIVYFH